MVRGRTDGRIFKLSTRSFPGGLVAMDAMHAHTYVRSWLDRQLKRCCAHDPTGLHIYRVHGPADLGARLSPQTTRIALLPATTRKTKPMFASSFSRPTQDAPIYSFFATRWRRIFQGKKSGATVKEMHVWSQTDEDGQWT